MAVLQVIGSTGAIQQSIAKQWAYSPGETSQTVYKGVYAAVSNLYEQYKAVAGYNPTYDQLSLLYNRGTGTLTVSTVQDGTAQYELIGNELSNPIWSHPYFLTSDTPSARLTADQIREVRRSWETGTETTCPFTDKQKTLYDMMSAGTIEYLVSSYVLRETKIVSKRSTVQASYVGVNTVVTPPSTSSVNSLIGALPTGEWLKKTPQVRMAGARRWMIETEWWWAVKWSAILYGGTG